MMLFLKVLLVVIVLPLVAGALLALVLRETYIHNPLPLGGTIGPRNTKTAEAEKPKITDVSALLPEDDISEADLQSSIALEIQRSTAGFARRKSPRVPADEPKHSEQQMDTSALEEDVLQHSEISVFDGTENIPDHIPVSSVLEAMTSETSAVVPGEFESIIEEVSQSGIVVPEDIHAISDDMDHEDIQALVEALPGKKIDFSQEIERDPEQSDAISPMGKELIGENFDFDALEKQANRMREVLQARQSFELDVQEDESGTIQVLSSFMFDATPQLEDFTMPQTIVPMFSDDWIQESNSTVALTEENTENLFFTEELRPMFVKKKKQPEPAV